MRAEAAKRVVVIGGGIVGLMTAWYALERGHRVTLLERGGPDHDCCSLGNAGMIVPSHFVPLAAPGMVGMAVRMLPNPESPFAIRIRPDKGLIDWGWRFMHAANAAHVERSAPLLRDLNLASVRAYEELSARFDGAFELVKNGLLMLCKTEKALEEEAHFAEKGCRLGLDMKVLTPAEAAAVDPDVTMDIAGAVHFRQDCHLTPGKLVARMTEAVAAGGATILWNAEATGWDVAPDGRLRAVRTPQGEVEGDEFVLAAGSWSPCLLRDLGIRLPMQGGKGYSVTLPRPRQLPRLCSLLAEARVAVTPMGGTLRVGGTMEVGGLDLSVNAARVRGIKKALPAYFPEFRPEDFDGLPVWSGLRPCSPDGLPYVGRFDRVSNLLAATGHAMMGVSLAPVTGQLIASLLSGEKPAFDIAALRPDRYS